MRNHHESTTITKKAQSFIWRLRSISAFTYKNSHTIMAIESENPPRRAALACLWRALQSNRKPTSENSSSKTELAAEKSKRGASSCSKTGGRQTQARERRKMAKAVCSASWRRDRTGKKQSLAAAVTETGDRWTTAGGGSDAENQRAGKWIQDDVSSGTCPNQREMKSLAAADCKDGGLGEIFVGSVKTKSKWTGKKNHSAGKFQGKNITARYNPSRTHGLVQQESSGNLVPALGGKNLAARKSKEKETGQHAGAKKTQAANGDFRAEEQSIKLRSWSTNSSIKNKVIFSYK
jgi:hypothetical protein